MQAQDEVLKTIAHQIGNYENMTRFLSESNLPVIIRTPSVILLGSIR